MRRERAGACACACAALASLVACGSEVRDSCEIENAELSMVAIAVDYGADIRVEVDLEEGDRSGPPAPVTLCDEDSLRLGGRSPTITEKPERIVYSVALPVDTAREIDVRLERRTIGSTVETTIALPPAFTIDAPTPHAEVSRDADLLIAWAPPDPSAEMRIALEEEIGYGLCVTTAEGEHDYKARGGVAVADDGDWMVPAGVVGTQVDEPCPAVYVLRRIALLPYPASLGPGGYVEARVQRSVEFTSIP